MYTLEIIYICNSEIFNKEQKKDLRETLVLIVFIHINRKNGIVT